MSRKRGATRCEVWRAPLESDTRVPTPRVGTKIRTTRGDDPFNCYSEKKITVLSCARSSDLATIRRAGRSRRFLYEDLRADRYPEFTLLDIEMALTLPPGALELGEDLMREMAGLAVTEDEKARTEELGRRFMEVTRMDPRPQRDLAHQTAQRLEDDAAAQSDLANNYFHAHQGCERNIVRCEL